MKDKLYKMLILMPFLWAFSGLFLFQNGDKLMVVAILISMIATLFNYGFDSIKKNIHDKGLWLVLTVTAYILFSYYYHGASSREVRTFIAATLLLLTFPRELINTNILKWLTVLGSVVTLVINYYFSLYAYLDRSLWPTNAIPLATIAATIAVLALALLLYAKNNSDRIVLSFSFIVAVIAVVISETRGVWLALIVAVVIVLCLKLKIKDLNWKYSLILLALFLASVYAVKPQIEQRIEYTKYEITQIQSGNLGSSMGLRLQMWALAPKMIEGHLILGSGNGHAEIFNALAQQGDIAKSLIEFDPAHYHNQYLDRLIKSGAIGLILLLVMLAYPLIFSAPGISRLSGIGIVSIYSIACLTDVPFNHGPTIFMYLLLIFTLKTKKNEAGC